MAEINLLKNELPARGGFAFKPKSSVFFYVLLGFLLVELLGYGGLLFYKRNLQAKLLGLERELASLDFEIGKLEKGRLEAVSFQARLKTLRDLLDNHLYWSRALEELEKHAYKLAKMQGLQADQTGHKFTIDGQVPNYTDLAKLMLGLQKSSNIESVILQSSSRSRSESGGYEYNLEVTFDPKLLLR